MKRSTQLLLGIAFLTCSSLSYANITQATWADDGDGAIVCGGNRTWSPNNATLSMAGNEYGFLGQPGAPAHMVGTITTDTVLDPVLTLSSAVQNDTGVAWIGYRVNIIMSAPFSFTTPGPTVANYPNPMPSGWTPDWSLSSTVAPTLQISGPYAGQYEGTLFFSAGTPLANLGELDFLYSIQFGSALNYSFTQEMIPVLVPEPGSLSLLGMGVCLLGTWVYNRRQPRR